MKRKPEKYASLRRKRIIAESVSNSFEDALREWIWTDLHKQGPGECDLCRKREVPALFNIRNKKNRQQMWVDKKCIIQLHLPMVFLVTPTGVEENLETIKWHLEAWDKHYTFRIRYGDFYNLVDKYERKSINFPMYDWEDESALRLTVGQVVEIADRLQKVGYKMTAKDHRAFRIKKLGLEDLIYISTLEDEVWEEILPILKTKMDELRRTIRKTGGKLPVMTDVSEIKEHIKSLL